MFSHTQFHVRRRYHLNMYELWTYARSLATWSSLSWMWWANALIYFVVYIFCSLGVICITHLPFARPEKERLNAPCQPSSASSELKLQMLSSTGLISPLSRWPASIERSSWLGERKDTPSLHLRHTCIYPSIDLSFHAPKAFRPLALHPHKP